MKMPAQFIVLGSLLIALGCSPILVSEKGVAITEKQADVFLGPNWNQTYFKTLPPQTRLQLLGMVRDWYKVRLPDGAIAWIHKSFVKIFPNVNTYALRKSRLRDGPGYNAGIIRIIPEGTQLTHLGEYGEWYRVALQDGTVGWILSSLVASR
ncbi:SH3 domain-containing protein [candidate division KSB1 bacterium]|nr:SH3 domain-containing protein [candidate division KSB1 bacterium]